VLGRDYCSAMMPASANLVLRRSNARVEHGHPGERERNGMAQVATPARIRTVQRTALVLLVLAGTLNYIDRWTLSMANPLVRRDLGLSVGQMGLLLSAFLWAYAFSQLPGGALVDRIGPRRLLGVGLALWSAAQACAGLVSGLAQ